MSRKVDTYRRLRALMLELGHDQTSLGKRVGMSRQQVSDRMICKTPWTLDEVYKVCDTLFIPIRMSRNFSHQMGWKRRRNSMETTIGTHIRWFNADEIVPSKDGLYLCQTMQGRYATLPFSTKYKMFNVSGDVSTALAVQWWAFLPELPQKEVPEDE